MALFESELPELPEQPRLQSIFRGLFESCSVGVNVAPMPSWSSVLLVYV